MVPLSNHADDVAGVGVVDDRSLPSPGTAGGCMRRNVLPDWRCVTDAFFKFARADAHETTRSWCWGFMLAWILKKTKDVNCSDSVDYAFQALAGLAGCWPFQEFSQERLDAEVGRGREAEEHRRQLAIFYFFHVEAVAGCVEKLNIVYQSLMNFFIQKFFENRVVSGAFG